jgi:uncharacterized protein (TIGR02444 family)
MPPAHALSPSGLWEFSLACYARPGVADACLHLQDQHGVNVNLLLWCAWLDVRGQTLDAASLHTAQKRIRGWDEHYVIPLRRLRRRMKVEFGVTDAGIEAVRAQIKQAELLAEKQLQLWLETVVVSERHEDEAGENPRADWNNVRFYLQHLRVTEGVITWLVDVLGVDSGLLAE